MMNDYSVFFVGYRRNNNNTFSWPYGEASDLKSLTAVQWDGRTYYYDLPKDFDMKAFAAWVANTFDADIDEAVIS